MSREPLARMDIDTRWPYHRKCRALQAAHPTDWPSLWCAYLAVLGESWAAGERVTLRDAWVPSIPIATDVAVEALASVGLLDKSGKVPAKSWDEWFGPAAARIDSLKARGRLGAQKRWSKREKSQSGHRPSDSTAIAQPSLANGQSMHHASQPATPASHATPGAREADPFVERPDDDVVALQKLAESLTGTPYGFPAHGPMGVKAAALATKHGRPAVEREWQRIAAEEGGMPTVRQLVLGADNALNRVSGPPVPLDPKAATAEYVARMNREAEEAKRARTA